MRRRAVRASRSTSARGAGAAQQGFWVGPMPARAGQLSTHRSRRRFSQRAAGLPWNLTLADAAEKVRVSESGHSQVAITGLGKVPAERLHPKAAYSRCRPVAAARVPRKRTIVIYPD